MRKYITNSLLVVGSTLIGIVCIETTSWLALQVISNNQNSKDKKGEMDQNTRFLENTVREFRLKRPLPYQYS